MRQLVENIRQVLSKGDVERRAITRLEALVGASVPGLQETRLLTESFRPGRYLCYRDQDFGFVVMMLVWGRGDGTAIHDHGTWGVEAVLRGSLKVTQYCSSESAPQPLGFKIVSAGDVMHNLPPDRDVHKVEHAGLGDTVAVSLHVYGRDMAANRQFIPGEGFKSCSLVCSDLCSELGRTFNLDRIGSARTL